MVSEIEVRSPPAWGRAAVVDRFSPENVHLLAPLQYRAAKVNFEYFLRLLELAIHYSGMGGEGDQSTI